MFLDDRNAVDTIVVGEGLTIEDCGILGVAVLNIVNELLESVPIILIQSALAAIDIIFSIVRPSREGLVKF